MARPAKIAPGPIVPSNLFQTPPSPTVPGEIPASVTSAWDHLRHTLGVEVPHNVNQALASAQRLRKIR